MNVSAIVSVWRLWLEQQKSYSHVWRFSCHLLKLCYKREDKDGNHVIYFLFHANAMFLHYCHNRIHRQRVSNNMRFYLKHSAQRELLGPQFKVYDLEKMSTKYLAHMVHHTVVQIRPLGGDPGHLRKVANDMRSFTMDIFYKKKRY